VTSSAVLCWAVQVVLELVELRELDTARAMLKQTQVLQRLKQEDPERYARLEQLTGRTYSDARDLYGANSSKEKRRAALANALAAEVCISRAHGQGCPRCLYPKGGPGTSGPVPQPTTNHILQCGFCHHSAVLLGCLYTPPPWCTACAHPPPVSACPLLPHLPPNRHGWWMCACCVPGGEGRCK
jgi:hypothetical protein